MAEEAGEQVAMPKTAEPVDSEKIAQECEQAWAALVGANQTLAAVVEYQQLYSIVLQVVVRRAKQYQKALLAWLEVMEG